MSPPKPPIHQFHPGVRRGEAIGELMLALREILRERGHASEIFVEAPLTLEGEARLIPDYAGDPGALVLVHHSIGHGSALRLSSLPDRLALWYHGIRPPAFHDDDPTRQRLARGRKQLVFFRGRVVGAIAGSRSFARELEESGYRDVLVLPPDAGEEREGLPSEDLVASAEGFLRTLDRWCRAVRPRPPLPRSPARHVQIEGPFESSYSLAVTNRRLAEALDAHTRYRVTLSCLDGGNGRFPRESNLADKPRARALFERSFLAGRPDILVRNTYPLRFERSDARIQLAKFYWEETKLPPGWAESFDRFFDGVLVASSWLRDVLRAEGVTVPVAVLPSVVEAPPEGGELPEEVRACRKRIRFLSVGSGFPRKGVDVLLRAFFRAFRAEDDVALVLKTFPNVHNHVADELEQMRRADPSAPEVIHIDRDLDDAALGALLRGADALVQPSRGEGFGLPAAEAMLLGIPVIATSATGLADFCREETCLVIPHTFAPSRSHLAAPGSVWAEPDEDALAALLRGFADASLRDEALRRAEAGRRLIAGRFSPAAVAAETERIFEEVEARALPAPIGYVTTWNTACGIATTTADLLRELRMLGVDARILANVRGFPLGPDGPGVARTWDREHGDYEPLVSEALEDGLEAVHVEFHPSLFFNYAGLAQTLEALLDRGLRVFFTFHVVTDITFGGSRQHPAQLAPALRRCHGVIAHTPADVDLLSGLGISASLIPLGGLVFPKRSRIEAAEALGLGSRRVIASFGFAAPHKGFVEAIEAAGLLRSSFPDLYLIVLASRRPETTSVEYLDLCRERIASLELEGTVLLVDRFLAEEEIGLLLAAAEVVVLPYGPTPETQSGAIRFPLAAGRATVTTGEPMFDDAGDAVFRIEGNRPEAIAEGVGRLLQDEALRRTYEERAARFASGRTWARSAEQHVALYRRAAAG